MIQRNKEPADTLLLSDTHLGLDLARPKEIKATLAKYDFNRLILLGDFFDNPASYIGTQEWNLLDYIKQLSKEREIIWVHGNHDDGISEHIAPRIGAALHQEYEWNYKGERHLAIHGHQFDDFIARHEHITEMASTLYRFTQRFDKYCSTAFSAYFKRNVQRWRQISKKVMASAVAYAKTKKINRIFCGHTHQAVVGKIIDGIHYYNTGSWTELPSTYITVGEKGVAVWEEHPDLTHNPEKRYREKLFG